MHRVAGILLLILISGSVLGQDSQQTGLAARRLAQDAARGESGSNASRTPGSRQSPGASADEEESTEMTVPAGTKIRIDLSKKQVAAPVQHGMTEWIPAQAPVSFEQADPGSAPASAHGARKTVRLTSITIGKSKYIVEANPVTIDKAQNEVEFTLAKHLTLPRE